MNVLFVTFEGTLIPNKAPPNDKKPINQLAPIVNNEPKVPITRLKNITENQHTVCP